MINRKYHVAEGAVVHPTTTMTTTLVVLFSPRGCRLIPLPSRASAKVLRQYHTLAATEAGMTARDAAAGTKRRLYNRGFIWRIVAGTSPNKPRTRRRKRRVFAQLQE